MRHYRVLLKVPNKVLLKQADKLIAKQNIIIGQNNSYIAELEDRIKVLEEENTTLKTTLDRRVADGCLWSKEVRQEGMYKNILNMNKKLREEIKRLQNVRDNLLCTLRK